MFHLFSEMKVEEYFIQNVWIQVKKSLIPLNIFTNLRKDKVIEYNFHSSVTKIKKCKIFNLNDLK